MALRVQRGARRVRRRAPAWSFKLPDGASVGSAQSTVHCLVQGNESFGNFTAGILVNGGVLVDNNVDPCN